jgi:hypothetical protein
LEQRLRITAEQKVRDDEDDRANSATYGNASATGSARVFNILAFSSSLPEHPSCIVARSTLAFTRPMTWEEKFVVEG